MSFKVSWELHTLCIIFGFIICFMLQNSIANIFINLFSENKILPFIDNMYLDMIIFISILVIPITFVHEIIHGFAYELFGGKVKYGSRIIYAYAQETSGIALQGIAIAILLIKVMDLI
ncbi:hypothetical protein [Clostridium tyrobutyricum]|uniref:hypothetical protein n=1 Tax=Clostridium tyrobutyricum TaxID=1519 RepID=UPI001C3856EA|nr:hypothetical protein [Clostridium tyrobutyricum]MBV4417482.1 hypothetical protein [Clostridium tyrobutyricum]MBV4423088.1 hypothetical protein [Clostridium tyrobutyricum]